ncbi:flagellar basal body L-ring protein FlgH [Stratiformator vulcanicus]|uniref:Flagellar L-ring protein n=1 Tax=Stratiformator vulcanicus TaxID=2527980 RepID=A0A517R3V9_9PLAN|nr:flagellar basal body L-ring protein FlgH [Stratiformator vulcanicus]QDT38578.1 Flagellar L-ring protein precursor [Stratiformator vulcanicus]
MTVHQLYTATLIALAVVLSPLTDEAVAQQQRPLTGQVPAPGVTGGTAIVPPPPAPGTRSIPSRPSPLAQDAGRSPMAATGQFQPPYNSAVIPFIPAIPRRRPGLVSEYSLTFIEQPPPRVIKENDIITFLVNHSSELSSDSRFNRQRNESFSAELLEFVALDGLILRNSAATSPTIDTSVQNRIQTTGQLQNGEGINFRIAGVVTDVLPNGNLVIEARKVFTDTDDEWEYRLSGIISSEKVNKDMTALAEDVAFQGIKRFQNGRIYDSTKRNWGTKIVDKIFPF